MKVFGSIAEEADTLSKRMALLDARLHKYRPDQDRDDHGRFEDEGGGSKPASAKDKPTLGQRAATAALYGGGLLLGYGALRGASNIAAGYMRTSRLRQEAAEAAITAAREAREARILRGHLRPKTRTQRTLSRLDDAAERMQRDARARMRRQARAARAAGRPKLTPAERTRIRSAGEHGTPTAGDPASKMPPDIPFWPF